MKYQEYLKELPDIVRKIIEDANVPEKMRQLAKEYKLHLDKWTALENEIMLSLVGAKPPENLAENIRRAIGVDTTVATAITEDVAKFVFYPIRTKLEQELNNRKSARETLMNKTQQTEQKNYTYSPGVKSTERKTIHDDPYREPIE